MKAELDAEVTRRPTIWKIIYPESRPPSKRERRIVRLLNARSCRWKIKARMSADRSKRRVKKPSAGTASATFFINIKEEPQAAVIKTAVRVAVF